MKKIYTLLSALVISSAAALAQSDTLLYEGFENPDIDTYMVEGISPGVANDQKWYNWDMDEIADGSTSGNRPGAWFLQYGYADVDSNTTVFAGNSWTNDPATPVMNWIITPAITISDANAVLTWKSAPFQTPRYMDGYKVLVSTTNNSDFGFKDTLFVAAEYISGDVSLGNDYSLYTFSPGFVHGADGQFVQENTADPARQTGVLRPFTESLAAYSGKTIYIAFVHDSHDDNLLSIDDILIMGTKTTGINEVAKDLEFSIYPNPATDLITLKMNLTSASPVKVEIYDVTGKVVKEEGKGVFTTGPHSITIKTADLATGSYTFVVKAGAVEKATKLIVK